MVLKIMNHNHGGSEPVSHGGNPKQREGRAEGWWGTFAEKQPRAPSTSRPTAAELLTIDYAPQQSRVSLSSARASVLCRAIAGAMPFGNHHQNAHNDPAQGIFAAASALGSM